MTAPRVLLIVVMAAVLGSMVAAAVLEVVAR